jgi:protein-S-isoprenylcysteine O-methyltransferase Ste14
MGSLISWHTLTTIWIAWLIYWAVSAQNVRPAQTLEPLPWRITTPLMMTLAAMLVFSRFLRFGPLARRFVPETPRIAGTAIFLVIAGLAISVWARRHLGQFWSSRVTLKTDHQLIQSGPYARVRHPIYSGLLLALIGTALFVGEWRAVAGVALVFATHWHKARREEALLSHEFGVDYEQYCRRTGSLIPRLF